MSGGSTKKGALARGFLIKVRSSLDARSILGRVRYGVSTHTRIFKERATEPAFRELFLQSAGTDRIASRSTWDSNAQGATAGSVFPRG